MEIDRRILDRYSSGEEADRLREPGRGDLIRLRTWDIFDRYIVGRRVADVGGGPGVHAGHLAQRGHEVVVVDPVPLHVEQAKERAATARYDVVLGDARALEFPDGSFDVVLLMGPLYHLTESSDRALALREAARILRPGGQLVAEVITRHAWVLDAMHKDLLDADGIWETFETNIAQGVSVDPSKLRPGGFWAYFHRVEDIEPELAAGGFDTHALIGVEGVAWLLSDLEHRIKNPGALLRAMRLVEQERSLLGASAHVIAVAEKTAAPGA